MITLRGLTKSYRTSSGRHYVFRDLNLTFPAGKSVGIIGHNGAGKSTLLRVIGGIDRPDRGLVDTKHSISWPVGLAGGFQGSMTGRENCKFVCRLYAEEAEIPSKLAFVQDFADIGKYFDMPVKTYSSGMRSRLSFGLSMAFDFDYYLIDEIAAVGDANFKKKSADILRQKRERSNFLMVSHDFGAIKKYCNLALLIGRGQVHLYGNIDEAVRAYQKDEALHQAAHANP
jgi:capsular polysaccharide transport system ATP-binding protein